MITWTVITTFIYYNSSTLPMIVLLGGQDLMLLVIGENAWVGNDCCWYHLVPDWDKPI